MKVLYLKTQGDNTIDLPCTLEVAGCECAVIEMTGRIESIKEDVYLCCDICEESSVGTSRMPVLRYINKRNNGTILNDIYLPIWLRVMRPTLNNIRLYIANESGEIMTFPRNSLNCTLVFSFPS